VTAATMANVKAFVEEGGTVIAIGSVSMAMAQQFGIPVTNHLVENGNPLPREKYFAPGCVLELAVDNKNPLAHGLESKIDVFFDSDPVFAMKAGSGPVDARAVAWFASAKPLRSGWAWGQHYLDKGVEIIDSAVGKGRVFIFAPEILFRAQPHGTYKLFFNGIYLSVAPEMKAGAGH
jgi:putative intracellular protease/amidase